MTPGSTAAPSLLRLGADMSELGRLYPWLEAAAAAQFVPPAVLHAMHVALEEAVANVVMHGFAAGATGHVVVTLRRAGGEATLEVEDDARPFDQAAAPLPDRPADVAEAHVGHRGLRLMRHYAARMDYVRSAGRNRLTLHFPLGPDA